MKRVILCLMALTVAAALQAQVRPQNNHTVSTTLGRRVPDRFSACMVSNPPGLQGPVIVYR